jgi:hypothetical protein
MHPAKRELALLKMIQQPEHNEPMTSLPMKDTIVGAVRLNEDINGVRFTNDEAAACEGSGLDFSGCLFERCVFSA